MAWCSECDRFLNPATVNADGTCPTCGRPVDVALEGGPASESDEIPRAPWHFKVAIAVVGIYLAFRAVQGVIWLFS